MNLVSQILKALIILRLPSLNSNPLYRFLILLNNSPLILHALVEVPLVYLMVLIKGWKDLIKHFMSVGSSILSV